MTVLDIALENQINKLSDAIKKLRDFKANNVAIRNQSLVERFNYETKAPNFLYIIRIDGGNSEEVNRLFDKFKTENKETHKLSSINQPSKEFDGVLYVGSSASLNTRMNQHLGHTGKKVYSLQLNEWITPLVTEVQIEIIPVAERFSEVLYPLENALWDYHQPLFGKKGTNVNSSSKI